MLVLKAKKNLDCISLLLFRKHFSPQLLQLLCHKEHIPGWNSPGNVQLEGGKKGLRESLESVIVEQYLMHECVGGGN